MPSAKSKLYSLLGSAKGTILTFSPLSRYHVTTSEPVLAQSSATGLPKSTDEALGLAAQPAAADQMLSGVPATAEPGLAIKRQEEISVHSEGISLLISDSDSEEQFSDGLVAGQGILYVLDDAYNKRTAQSIRRHMAELQACQCEEKLKALRQDTVRDLDNDLLRQCEQKLKALRQDVQDLDNDLLETNNYIERLQYLAQQHTMFSSTRNNPADAGVLLDSGSINFDSESASSSEYGGA